MTGFLLVLAATIYARYPRRLAGTWRWIYVTGIVAALYLDLFVSSPGSKRPKPQAASASALEVLAPDGVDVMLDDQKGHNR